MSDHSLSRHAVDSIRGFILEGRIKPGEKLNVDGLARMLNISKTPVRDAMNMLVAEKLVAYRPRLGYSVLTLTPAEFLDLSELQEAIETHIYLQVAKGDDPIDYDALEEISRETLAAIADRNAIRIFSLNEVFHMTIYRNCHNKKMLERLRELWNEILIHRFHMFSSATFLSTIPTDHANILAALKKGHTGEIIDAVHAHFHNGNMAAIEGFAPLS